MPFEVFKQALQGQDDPAASSSHMPGHRSR